MGSGAVVCDLYARGHDRVNEILCYHLDPEKVSMVDLQRAVRPCDGRKVGWLRAETQSHSFHIGAGVLVAFRLGGPGFALTDILSLSYLH